MSASQDEAARHERAFLCFFKDDIASVLDGTSIGFHGINCFHLFFIWEARVGLTILIKMSSLIAVMGYEVNKRKRTT